MLPVLTGGVVGMLVVVRVNVLVSVEVPDRLRWLPACEVTVSTPMRMVVNMRSVPVTSFYAHSGKP